MSLTCSSADVSALTTNAAAIQACILEAQGTNLIASGPSVKACMETSSLSTGCAQCWGNLYGDFKTCFIDTCKFTPETTLAEDLPQGCLECLGSVTSQYMMSTKICGISATDIPTGSAENIAAEIQKWADVAAKSSTPSVRSIGTSVLVFALFMMAI